MKTVLKNDFLALILLLVIIIPSQLLMLKFPIYPSQDGLYHVARIEQFDQSIRLGKVPPRLAPSLYGGIGYPLFVVNYQLPYYMAEPFMLFLKNSYVSFKVVMSVSYVLSIVFSFFLFRNLGGRLASLTGATLFAYLPYRFANLYDRASFGESVAMMFVPLTLLSLHKINKRYGVIFLSISLFGLITSHTVVFIIFVPFFLGYLMIFLKLNKKTLTRIFFGFIFGFLLSSFQLFPSIFDKNYLKFDENLLGIYRGHFFSFAQMLRLPVNGVNIGTPFQVGIAAIFIFFLSLLNYIFNRSKIYAFLISVIIFSFFLTQKESLLIWQKFPLIDYILYPWRFLSLILVSSSIMAVFIVDKFKFKRIFAVFLITLALISSRHYFLSPTQIESSMPTASTTTSNEYDTVWSGENTFGSRPLVSSSNPINVSSLDERGVDLRFKVKSQKNTNIIIRRLFFPGWKIKVDNSKNGFFQQDGLISIPIEKGQWDVSAVFDDTPYGKVGSLVTIVAIFTLFFYFLILSLGKSFFLKRVDVLKLLRRHVF